MMILFDVSKNLYSLSLQGQVEANDAKEMVQKLFITFEYDSMFNVFKDSIFFEYKECVYSYDTIKNSIQFIRIKNNNTNVGAIYFGHSYLYEILKIIKKGEQK